MTLRPASPPRPRAVPGPAGMHPALAAAAAAARSAGVDVAHCRLLRPTAVATVAVLDHTGPVLIARVHLGATDVTGLVRTARIARRLRAAGVGVGVPHRRPAVRVGGDTVSLWRWVEHRADPADPAEVGAVLRALHSASARWHPTLPPLSVHAGLHDLVDATPSGVLTGRQARAVGRRAAAAVAAMTASGLGFGLVHGDVHPANFLATEAGAVILDLDAAAVDDHAWDLVPAVVAARRFGATDRLERTAVGYGITVADAIAATATLVPVKELDLVARLAHRAARDRTVRSELHHRLATLDSDEPWATC